MDRDILLRMRSWLLQSRLQRFSDAAERLGLTWRERLANRGAADDARAARPSPTPSRETTPSRERRLDHPFLRDRGASVARARRRGRPRRARDRRRDGGLRRVDLVRRAADAQHEDARALLAQRLHHQLSMNAP